MSIDGQSTPQNVPVSPPAPGPRKKGFFARHKVLTVFAVVVLVIVVIAVAASGSSGGDQAQLSAQSASTSKDDSGAAADNVQAVDEDTSDDTPGIGTAVRDGKFKMTVTKVKTGVKRIGDQYLHEKAQGQFVLVKVKVKNIGDEGQYFDGSSQTLVDRQGRQHSADDGAAIYLKDSDSFLNEINPGNSVLATVVFDIPKKATPDSIELHDSALSDGISVSLAS